MKQIFTVSFLLIAIAAFSQQKNGDTNPPKPQQNQVTAQGSDLNRPSGTVRRRSTPVTPLPYDVNDKYMGRKAEFLGNLTVSELPSDFPAYEKIWSLKEYNQVVLAFYYNHRDIVRKGVNDKLDLLKH
jgi:hypothetical protein